MNNNRGKEDKEIQMKINISGMAIVAAIRLILLNGCASAASLAQPPMTSHMQSVVGRRMHCLHWRPGKPGKFAKSAINGGAVCLARPWFIMLPRAVGNRRSNNVRIRSMVLSAGSGPSADLWRLPLTAEGGFGEVL